MRCFHSWLANINRWLKYRLWDYIFLWLVFSPLPQRQTQLECFHGSWDRVISCQPVDCGLPDPSYIYHAIFSCPGGTTFGKECSFTCGSPAILQGKLWICTRHTVIILRFSFSVLWPQYEFRFLQFFGWIWTENGWSFTCTEWRFNDTLWHFYTLQFLYVDATHPYSILIVKPCRSVLSFSSYFYSLWIPVKKKKNRFPKICSSSFALVLTTLNAHSTNETRWDIVFFLSWTLFSELSAGIS